MEIKVRGWHRDAGTKKVADFDIEDAQMNDSIFSFKEDILYMKNVSKGVNLSIGPATIVLGGDYQVDITLSSDDINRLFWHIHPELESCFTPKFENSDVPPLERNPLRRPITPIFREDPAALIRPPIRRRPIIESIESNQTPTASVSALETPRIRRRPTPV